MGTSVRRDTLRWLVSELKTKFGIAINTGKLSSINDCVEAVYKVCYEIARRELLTEIEDKNNELKRRVLETNSLNEKIKILEEELQQKDNSSKLRKELKEKDELLKIYEDELKKYRKEEKERKEFSKALGETIKEMKTKE